MNIPAHLRYTRHHLWVERQSDGSARTGITDHAQETLGDIVFVDAPAIGSSVTAGQPCGVIESVKTASDLHAPISGTITGTNDALQISPENINETPYSAWIFSIDVADPSAFDQLLDADGYRQFLDQ